MTRESSLVNQFYSIHDSPFTVHVFGYSLMITLYHSVRESWVDSRDSSFFDSQFSFHGSRLITVLSSWFVFATRDQILFDSRFTIHDSRYMIYAYILCNFQCTISVIKWLSDKVIKKLLNHCFRVNSESKITEDNLLIQDSI